MRRPWTVSLVILLYGLAAAGRAAVAEVSLTLRPGYTAASTTTTDETGLAHHSSTSQLVGDYHLGWTKTLFPLVRLAAGGNLADNRSLGDTDSGSVAGSRTSSVFANLDLGNPFVGASGTYSRRQASTSLADAPSLVNEVFGVSGRLNPAGLPRLNLRADRILTFDTVRALADRAETRLQLGALYSTIDRLTLSYSLTESRIANHLDGVDTATTTQGGRATYGDSWWSGRTTFYLSYGYSAQTASTVSRGAGGTVSTQRFPVGGLSLVETFPTQPTQTTLKANAALIDGNTSASAGLNLGFSPSVAGDRDIRDMGVVFADATVEANTVFVWVDRQLPPQVVQAFAWRAFASDDNVAWTEVDVVGSVLFGAFEHRFEVTIERTTARYLKIVTTPLAPTVTADQAFADILVTEVQVFLVVPASLVAPESESSSSALSVTARTRLFREHELSHDVSLILNRYHSPSARTTYLASTGLSYHRKVSVIDFAGRLAREDLDQGQGHESTWVYAASAAASPWPTLRGSAAASGQRRSSSLATNTLSLLGSAELYEGVAILANGSYMFGRTDKGQAQRGVSASASVSLAPHRTLSLSGSIVHSETTRSGAGLPEARTRDAMAQGSATFHPFPALAVSGEVSSTWRREGPSRTLAGMAGSFSPFPGGDLQLSFSFSESLDPSGEGRARRLGPSVRWKIRRQAFVDATYTYLGHESPVGTSRSHAFSSLLTVAL